MQTSARLKLVPPNIEFTRPSKRILLEHGRERETELLALHGAERKLARNLSKFTSEDTSFSLLLLQMEPPLSLSRDKETPQNRTEQ